MKKNIWIIAFANFLFIFYNLAVLTLSLHINGTGKLSGIQRITACADKNIGLYKKF